MSRAQLTSTVEQNTGGAVAPYVAGKNKIINGDYSVAQRGTSITLTTGSTVYTLDRWLATSLHSAGTATVSQQTFTPGAAPVAGYEGTYFCRFTLGSAGSPSAYMETFQRIEDVRTFAGQTVTLSFWAKASVATNFSPYYSQNFGSGGSATVTNGLSTISVTTSWVRYTQTFTLPSISGKTVGSSSYLQIALFGTYLTNSQTLDIWGVQFEAGSVATPFQTATGTLSGELAACQRYYFRQTGVAAGSTLAGTAIADTTTTAGPTIFAPVIMRTQPSAVDFSALRLSDGYTGVVNVTNITGVNYTTNAFAITATVASGLTTGRVYVLQSQSASGYIGFSAEL